MPAIIWMELDSDSFVRLQHLIVLFNLDILGSQNEPITCSSLSYLFLCKSWSTCRCSLSAASRAIYRWLLKAITSGPIACLLNGRTVNSHKKLTAFQLPSFENVSFLSLTQRWVKPFDEKDFSIINLLMPAKTYVSKIVWVLGKILLIELIKRYTYLKNTLNGDELQSVKVLKTAIC